MERTRIVTTSTLTVFHKSVRCSYTATGVILQQSHGGNMISQQPVPTELEVLATVERSICQRIPDTWRCDTSRELGSTSRNRIDSLLTLTSPDGTRVRVVIEVKAASTTLPLNTAIAQLTKYTEAMEAEDAGSGGSRTVGLVAAPYLSPSARKKITVAGFAYADTTGNIRLSVDQPAVFLETQGDDRNPWPQPTGIKSLKGSAAGAAVRALLDFRPPIGIRDLAARAGVSASTLSRVTDLLDNEDLVERGPTGTIESADWSGILRRWALDYSVLTSNAATSFLAPRGLDDLFAHLRDTSEPFAVSGSAAVPVEAKVAPDRLATVYAERPDELAIQTGLRRVDQGANCLLLSPYDPVVFKRTRSDRGLRLVALSQLAVDLITGPGRAPAEAEELMTWMGKSEDVWRI